MRTYKRKSIGLWIAACSYGASLAMTALPAHAVMEEVVVEAQKKKENILDTPVAVTAISGEEFTKGANFNLQDIARSTPGLKFDVGVTPDIHLRGTSTVTLAGVSARTNIYQDGALIEQPRVLFDAQFDIASFEILKGPQGTLYGKTSPTGTILIKTKNPNLNEVDGYLSQSVAQYDSHNSQFGISLPIIEGVLGVRIAGVYDENNASDAHNVVTGADATSRSTGGRITVLFEPNEDFNARLSYHYRENKSNPSYIVDGAGYKYDDDKITSNVNDYNFTRDQLATLELNYTISDHLLLSSLTGYEDQEYRNMQDVDGRPDISNSAALPNGRTQFTHIPIRPQIQQDIRLVSDDNPFWDWQVGFYYHRLNTQTAVNRTQSQAASASFPIQVSAIVNTTAALSQEEYAVYTHNTFKITDAFNVIAGLRYQQTRQRSHQPTTGMAYYPDSGNPLVNLNTGDVYNDGDPVPFLNLGPLINSDGIPSNLTALTTYPVTGSLKFQYKFTPDTMGYLTLDRAFRPGAANLNIQGNTPSDFAGIPNEATNSIELGLKGQFLDGRGRYTTALYHQIYQNYQQDQQNVYVYDPLQSSISELLGGGGVATQIQNLVTSAKRVEINGLEGDLGFNITESWLINVSLALTDAKYIDYKNFACDPGSSGCSLTDNSQLTPSTQYAVKDLSDERVPASSRWSGTLSTDYFIPVTGGKELYFRAINIFQSNQIDKVTRSTLPGYATWDFFTGLRSSGDPHQSWDVNVWLKNAFNRRVITRIYNPNVPTAYYPDGATDSGGANIAGQPDLTQPSFDMVNVNPPRQVGITGTYRF